jgi:glycosyltransferase involved in cell wall biosynthesis
MPAFTVILPTYNHGHVLWRAVSSVLAQSFSDFRLLIVDDGSTDNTQRLCEEFRDARVQYFRTGNGGPSAARNFALLRAQSPFVSYLDADNVYHPEFLASFYEIIGQTPGSVFWYCGQRTLVWSRDRQRRWQLVQQRMDVRGNWDLPEALSLRAPDTSSVVHRRELFDHNVRWDPQCRYLEDWQFFVDALTTFGSGRCTWLTKPLVEYRVVEGEAPEGICPLADVAGTARAGRDYLLEKWQRRLSAAGIERLRSAPALAIRTGR